MATTEQEFSEFIMSDFTDVAELTENTDILEEDKEIEKTEIDIKREDVTSDPVITEEIVASGEDGSPEGKETPPDQGNYYHKFASALSTEGLLSSFDPTKDKLETKEDFIDLIRNEIKTNEFSDLSDSQKKYLQAVRTGVKPEEAYQQVSLENQLQSISAAELEKEESTALRKELIVASFLIKGYNKEKSIKLAQRSIDSGDDVNDALESLNEVKEHYQKEYEEKILTQQRAKDEAKTKETERISSFKKLIEDTNEVIPKLSITRKVKDDIYKQAMTIVAKGPNGESLNALAKAHSDDPIGYTYKLNYLFNITKGFTDFSKITTAQKTKAVSELDDFIKGNTFIPSGSQSVNNMDISTNLQDGFSSEMINNIK